MHEHVRVEIKLQLDSDIRLVRVTESRDSEIEIHVSYTDVTPKGEPYAVRVHSTELPSELYVHGELYEQLPRYEPAVTHRYRRKDTHA